MEKQVTFLGKSESGIFCQSLFSGAMEKTAGVPAFADWSTGDELRAYIKTITREDRKKYCYVLVNALGAGEFFGCFPAGSMVRTKRGDVPIELVVVGDEVLTHENRWRTVLGTKPKEQLDGLVHISIGGVPKLLPAVSATPNHEILIVPRDSLLATRRKWFYKRGEVDREAAYQAFVSNLEPEWVAIEHSRPGDYVYQPFPTDEGKGEFQEKWGSLDFAFLMGLYTAEGCLAKRYDRDSRTTKASEEDWYEKLVFVLGSTEGAIAERVKEIAAKYNHSAHVVPEVETHSIRVELQWRELAQECLKHIGHHATEKALSWDIVRMPVGWQEAFLSAYAGGDGHICGDSIWRSRDSLVLTTSSKHLALDVRLIFARLGIVSTVNGRHNEKSTWYNGNPIYAVCVGGSWRREDGITRAESFIDQDKGFIISPIKEVWRDDSWRGQVFDLSVEEDHSYVVNGVVVHNSNINADYFPWNALAHEGDDYGYKTFLNANAFQHHKNKEPEKAFGKPVLSVLNTRMKRVELIIKLDREKAKIEQADGIISRIDAGEFPDVSMGCLPKYAKVLRKDGTFVEIEHIREGDEVISHRGLVRKVTSTMVRPHKGTIYHVKPYGHRDPLVLTEEHPLWLVRAEQTKCHPTLPVLKTGRPRDPKSQIQHVCTPDSPLSKKGCSGCQTRLEYKFEWIRTDSAEVGDYLALPIPSFEVARKFSEEEARLLGYYLAEGNVQYTSAGHPRSVVLSTGLHEIETHAEIRDIVSRLGLDDSFSEFDAEERNGKYLTINSRYLASLCSEHCGNGAKTKRLSVSVMGADERTLQLLLGAYANGDGGCYKGSIYLSTASEQLSDQLRIVLARLRCIASVNEILHKPSKLVHKETVEFQVWVGTDSAWRLQNTKFTTLRKSEKLNSKRFFYEHKGVTYLMTPIESIDEVEYDDSVYNFSVAEDESYLVDGLAVHNCKVPYDICSICDHRSKTRADYCQHMGPPAELRHIYGPNKILPDGRKIYVVNTLPRFFDISFVFIGADKTAKVMAKLASKGNQVCLGNVCTLSNQSNDSSPLVDQLGQPIKTAGLHKTASSGGMCGPCGRLCSECSEQRACHTTKLASAFRSKVAGKKLAEIIKDIPAGSFAMKRLPELEREEPSIERDDLDSLSKLPLPSVLGAGSSLGMVLKPHEFQRMVLMRMGEDDFANSLSQANSVFRPVESFDEIHIDCNGEIDGCLGHAISQLTKYVNERSAFGVPFTLRLTFKSRGGKKNLPTPTPISHPLLDKISSAYNGYRRNFLMKMSQVEESIRSDPRLREVVLGDGLVNMFSKTASTSPVITLDSVAYLVGAHLSNRNLLTNTAITDAVAVMNEGLLEESSLA